MDAKPVSVSGRVVCQPVSPGSKSARDAVVLRTDQGEEFVLRRHDGPSFGDAALHAVVGTSIRTTGVAIGNTLIIKDWTVE